MIFVVLRATAKVNLGQIWSKEKCGRVRRLAACLPPASPGSLNSVLCFFKDEQKIKRDTNDSNRLKECKCRSSRRLLHIKLQRRQLWLEWKDLWELKGCRCEQLQGPGVLCHAGNTPHPHYCAAKMELQSLYTYANLRSYKYLHKRSQKINREKAHTHKNASYLFMWTQEGYARFPLTVI